MKQIHADDENALTSTKTKKPAVHLTQFFDNLPKFEDLDSATQAKYFQLLDKECKEAGLHPNLVQEALDRYNRCSINTTADLKEFKRIQIAVMAFLSSKMDNSSKENRLIIYQSLKKLQGPLDKITNSLENRLLLLKDIKKILDHFQRSNPVAKFLHDLFVNQIHHVMKSINLVSNTYKTCLEELTKLIDPKYFMAILNK